MIGSHHRAVLRPYHWAPSIVTIGFHHCTNGYIISSQCTITGLSDAVRGIYCKCGQVDHVTVTLELYNSWTKHSMHCCLKEKDSWHGKNIYDGERKWRRCNDERGKNLSRVPCLRLRCRGWTNKAVQEKISLIKQGYWGLNAELWAFGALWFAFACGLEPNIRILLQTVSAWVIEFLNWYIYMVCREPGEQGSELHLSVRLNIFTYLCCLARWITNLLGEPGRAIRLYPG